MATLARAAAPRAGIGPGLRRRLDWLGVLPFAVFVALFLLWPTVLVVLGAFQDPEGGLTLANLAQAAQGSYLQTFVTSILLSTITAVLGAVFGGLLAWAISVGRRDGLLRRVVLAGSGTLAQFGGVMLAFAFLATFGFNGLVTCSCTTGWASTPSPGAAGSTSCPASSWSTPISRSRSW